MCDTPASKLVAARIAAGYDKATPFWRAHRHRLPVGEVTYRAYENGERWISEQSAVALVKVFESLGVEVSVGDLRPRLADVATGSDLQVIGEVRMGNYIDPAVMEGRRESVRGIPAMQDRDARRALRIADESVNKYVGGGGYAIYRPIDPRDPGLLEQYDGELLYIETRIGKLAEYTIRVAKLQKDGRLKLTAYSTVAKFLHQRAAMYPCTEGDVKLLGVVVARYEPGGAKELSTKK